MAKKKKKYEPTNPNKRTTPTKPVITCPECGSDKLTYEPDRRRIPSKWYVHVGTLVAIIVFAIAGMPAFSITFGIVYLYYTLVRKQKVLVGTCQECGKETLFNQPEDGSLEPDFNKPWV